MHWVNSNTHLLNLTEKGARFFFWQVTTSHYTGLTPQGLDRNLQWSSRKLLLPPDVLPGPWHHIRKPSVPPLLYKTVSERRWEFVFQLSAHPGQKIQRGHTFGGLSFVDEPPKSWHTQDISESLSWVWFGPAYNSFKVISRSKYFLMYFTWTDTVNDGAFRSLHIWQS